MFRQKKWTIINKIRELLELYVLTQVSIVKNFGFFGFFALMKWFDIKNKNYWRVSGGKEYTIQEVSQLTGITVRTLRNYLKSYENLIEPRRGYYNSLIFDQEDVQIFVMIKTLIKDGFKPEEIDQKVQEQLPELRQEMEQARKQEEDLVNKESKESTVKQLKLPKKIESKELVEREDDSGIRVSPKLLENMNDYFLSLEKRNAMLEHKLNHIEGLLEEMNQRNSVGFIPRSFNSLVDSTSAFWDALKKSLP